MSLAPLPCNLAAKISQAKTLHFSSGLQPMLPRKRLEAQTNGKRPPRKILVCRSCLRPLTSAKMGRLAGLEASAAKIALTVLNRRIERDLEQLRAETIPFPAHPWARSGSI